MPFSLEHEGCYQTCTLYHLSYCCPIPAIYCKHCDCTFLGSLYAGLLYVWLQIQILLAVCICVCLCISMLSLSTSRSFRRLQICRNIFCFTQCIFNDINPLCAVEREERGRGGKRESSVIKGLLTESTCASIWWIDGIWMHIGAQMDGYMDR